MTERQHDALKSCEVDFDGVNKRFNNDWNLYISCLKLYIEDTSIQELNEAIMMCSWDEAFTKAHALKGVAGNMGFVSLMYAISQLLIVIRQGKTDCLGEYVINVNKENNRIIKMIKNNFI